jgi:hypothetical protein
MYSQYDIAHRLLFNAYSSYENFMLLTVQRGIIAMDTERRGRVVNTPASYPGGPGFKFRPFDRLSWLIFFVVSLSPIR